MSLTPREHPARRVLDHAAVRGQVLAAEQMTELGIPEKHHPRLAAWAKEIAQARLSGEFAVARRLVFDGSSEIAQRLEDEGWQPPPPEPDSRSGDDIAAAVARRSRS